MTDDLVKTWFGLGGLETASSGAFNPDYGYTPDVQNQYDHMNMNTVSIQCSAVDLPRVVEPERCLARAYVP